MSKFVLLLALAVVTGATAPLRAQAPVDAAMLNRIADAELNHGEVIQTAAYLADQIGGRLTNSPAMRTAERWTQGRFVEWGLKNVHAEAFDFGRGWWIEAAHARLLAPRTLELRAIPIAWTPPTNGPLSASIIVAPIRTEQDFATWQGKLAGKIVLITWPEPPRDATEPAFQRLSEADLSKLDVYLESQADPESLPRIVALLLLRTKIDDFLAREGALASVQMSRTDGRVLHGEGFAFQVGRTRKLPAIELAAEDYRRLARLAKLGEVRMELDNRVHFEDGDHDAYNILADIPGTSRRSYVMAGAHLDSWVAGDGAADDGAGVAVVMESARILARLGAHPRRTIRFALWAGEEQGLLGSGAYVEKHIAHRPVRSDPAVAALGPYFAPDSYPVQTRPGFVDLAGYFNVDNGSGRIRGIYTEGNLAVVPIFREWLAPFKSLGAVAVVAQPTVGTDHASFSRLGLPAFQFIQDPLDYDSRVHHTDLDTFDHLRVDDLRQASMVLAAMLLDAANAAEPLPRKVLPTQPSPADPFHYPEPSKPQ
jgi:carboxypeptidase Q